MGLVLTPFSDRLVCSLALYNFSLELLESQQLIFEHSHHSLDVLGIVLLHN